MEQEVKDIIADKPNSIQLLFSLVRDAMLATSPLIKEEILGGNKVKMAYYSIGDRNNPVGVIGPAKDHVKLFFHHFNTVDTTGLKLEGSGKHARHVKLRPDDDLEMIGPLLKQVAEVCAAKIAE
jgi:hypothetical protein